MRVGDGDSDGNVQWCFSQVKGAMDDDVAEGKFLSLFRAVVSILNGLKATLMWNILPTSSVPIAFFNLP